MVALWLSARSPTLVVVRTGVIGPRAEGPPLLRPQLRSGGHLTAPRKGTCVIEARKVKLWDRRYDVLEDGRPVAIWERSLWSTGGTIRLEGRNLHVRTNLLGCESSMSEAAGPPIAVARSVGRKNWTIESDGATYHFRRSPPWRQAERLHHGGLAVGWIRRTRPWRGEARAELPGLPRTVQVFAVALVLSRWESESAASA